MNNAPNDVERLTTAYEEAKTELQRVVLARNPVEINLAARVVKTARKALKSAHRAAKTAEKDKAAREASIKESLALAAAALQESSDEDNSDSSDEHMELSPPPAAKPKAAAAKPKAAAAKPKAAAAKPKAAAAKPKAAAAKPTVDSSSDESDTESEEEDSQVLGKRKATVQTSAAKPPKVKGAKVAVPKASRISALNMVLQLVTVEEMEAAADAIEQAIASEKTGSKIAMANLAMRAARTQDFMTATKASGWDRVQSVAAALATDAVTDEEKAYRTKCVKTLAAAIAGRMTLPAILVESFKNSTSTPDLPVGDSVNSLHRGVGLAAQPFMHGRSVVAAGAPAYLARYEEIIMTCAFGLDGLLHDALKEANASANIPPSVDGASPSD